MEHKCYKYKTYRSRCRGCEVHLKKRCYRCKTEKDISEFNKCATRGDGVQAACRDCSRITTRNHYKKNPSKYDSYYKENRKKFPEKYIELNKLRKQARLERKLSVISKYGGCCSCCGEKEPLFLSVDHKNEDGAKHRKEIGGSSYIYDWIIKNNYPDTIQILCHNCNQGRYINGGICPHKQNV